MSHKISKFEMKKDYIAEITFFNNEKIKQQVKQLLEISNNFLDDNIL